MARSSRFPDAIVPIGRGFEWDHAGDTPFLRQLVAELRNRYPTRSGRVSIVGMSGGARMACHFASSYPDEVSMVGAVAGLRSPDGPAGGRPVPVLAFHGTADRINPYDGSGTARWRESVPDAARAWAEANGSVSGADHDGRQPDAQPHHLRPPTASPPRSPCGPPRAPATPGRAPGWGRSSG